MLEVKRIFRNPSWLTLLVIVLSVNIIVYLAGQTDFGTISMSHYRQVHQDWEYRLTQAPASDGIALLDQAESELLWQNSPSAATKMLAISRWESRLRHIAGYDAKLAEIQQQAEFMRTISIYNDPDSFAFKNIEQTAADFKRLEGCKLTPGNDEVLTSVVTSRSVNICSLVLMLATVLMFFDDRSRGMRGLVYGFPNGRLRLGLYRFIAIVFTAALAVAAIHGTTAIASMALYGDFIDTNRMIQSVVLFADYTIPMRAGEFLALYAALQFCGCVLSGLLFWAILMWTPDYRIGCAMIAVLTAIEYVLYSSLTPNDALGWLAGANIFVIWSPVQVFAHYLNYDLFGTVVSAFTLVVGTIIFWTVALGILCLIGQARIRPAAAKKIHLLRYRDKWPAHMSEWRKFRLCGRSVLVLVLYGCVLFTQFSLPGLQLTQAEAIYQDYAASNGGRVSQDMLRQIQLDADTAQEELALLQRDTSIPPLVLQEKLLYANAKVTAFETLINNVSWLLQFDNTWLISSSTYENLFGTSSENYRLCINAVTLLALVLLLAPLFGCEHQHGTQSYLLTLPNGRIRLASRKLCVAFISTVLLWLVQAAFECYLIYQKWGGFAGLTANGLSLSFWDSAILSWPIWVHILTVYLCRLCVLLSAATLILLITASVPRVRAAMCICVAVFAAPMVTGIDWLQSNCHIGALSANGLVADLGGCIAWILVGIAAAFITVGIWRRKSA